MTTYLIMISICLYLIVSCLIFLYEYEELEKRTNGEVFIPLDLNNIIHYVGFPYTILFKGLFNDSH